MRISVISFSLILLTMNFAIAKSSKLQRGKRYLDFLKNTRMFFRANVKNNMLKVNQIWAYSFGFRANYPIENDLEHRPFRRDVYKAMELLMEQHGFDGKACILKSFCRASKDKRSETSGILFKVLQLIFTLNKKDRTDFPHLSSENCENQDYSNCPLSLDSISPYTDDV